jgi:hypothetical protein
LLWHSPDLSKLSTKEPQMTDEDALSDRCWSDNQVDQKDSVKVSSLFVSAKLLDSPCYNDLGALQQTKVFSSPDNRTHIATPVN